MKDALRQEGGYAFTHVGKLERSDSGEFSSTKASEVLASLHWFLSFVRGIWVCPVLVSGEDSSGETRWRQWDAGRTSRWAGPPTWCDLMHWEAAEDAYRGFMAEWGDLFGQAVMKTAVGQYVSANRPDPLEVAIMVAQSGLELLGWAEFVETGAVTEDEWSHETRASNKIRKLLDSCSMSPDIPDSLTTLPGLKRSWQTGPEVVAGVRNRLVHPRKKDGRVSWDLPVLVDTWMLITHYLERAILKRLQVSTAVRSRLNPNIWVGAVETPPWTPQAPTPGH
jgi:hypothetical protein